MISENTLAKTLNQLHEVKRQAAKENNQPILRACQRIAAYLEEDGILVHDPLGEAYNNNRTDCEANIIADGAGASYITEVLKPAIYRTQQGKREIIQQAVVIVEAGKK